MKFERNCGKIRLKKRLNFKSVLISLAEFYRGCAKFHRKSERDYAVNQRGILSRIYINFISITYLLQIIRAVVYITQFRAKRRAKAKFTASALNFTFLRQATAYFSPKFCFM